MAEEAVATPILSIKNASLSFENKIIFSQLNFDLIAGKWVALMGASGVGKTSLLRIIAGLEPKQASLTAQISLDNQAKDKLAYLPQRDALLPWLTVEQNIMLRFK